MKKRINLSVDSDTYERFKEYCQINGMKVSSKVEKFMEAELKRK